VRLRFANLARRACIPMVALALLFAPAAVPLGSAQGPDTMLPEQSEAKAREILQNLINAYGGPGYMEVRESDCEGRMARFGHNGELTGYVDFKDYWRYPDKNRTDYAKKGVIVDVYNGDQGWTLDKGGVSEQNATAVSDFQEQVKKDINNLLRIRLKEPGMIVRFAGTDIVDLKTVDWVEIVDQDQRLFRLAVDQSSHLLVRSQVIVGDETTHDRSVETNIYSNYQLMDSVRTALQITTDRDGRRTSQIFFQFCKYNPGFPDDLFSKASLQKRFSEVGSRKYKDEKKKEKEEN
jgi:outer membrane lipoprotein-sorting protein